jgi:hypothetical protein
MKSSFETKDLSKVYNPHDMEPGVYTYGIPIEKSNLLKNTTQFYQVNLTNELLDIMKDIYDKAGSTSATKKTLDNIIGPLLESKTDLGDSQKSVLKACKIIIGFEIDRLRLKANWASKKSKWFMALSNVQFFELTQFEKKSVYTKEENEILWKIYFEFKDSIKPKKSLDSLPKQKVKKTNSINLDDLDNL